MHANTWRVKHFFFIAIEVAVYIGPYTEAAAAAAADHMWIWL